jgi:hypothetical protein
MVLKEWMNEWIYQIYIAPVSSQCSFTGALQMVRSIHPGLTQKSIWGFMKQLQTAHMSSTSRETKWWLGLESNPLPLDHEADTLPLHHRALKGLMMTSVTKGGKQNCPKKDCLEEHSMTIHVPLVFKFFVFGEKCIFWFILIKSQSLKS